MKGLESFGTIAERERTDHGEVRLNRGVSDKRDSIERSTADLDTFGFVAPAVRYRNKQLPSNSGKLSSQPLLHTKSR